MDAQIHTNTPVVTPSQGTRTPDMSKGFKPFQNIHIKCHIDNNFRCCNINIFDEMMNVEEYIKDLRTNN